MHVKRDIKLNKLPLAMIETFLKSTSITMIDNITSRILYIIDKLKVIWYFKLPCYYSN